MHRLDRFWRWSQNHVLDFFGGGLLICLLYQLLAVQYRYSLDYDEAEDFPDGTTNLPVKSGQLLGYQGTLSKTPNWPTWVHMPFAIADGTTQGSFPADPSEVVSLDPAPYLGLSVESGYENPQPLKCKQP